MFEIPCILFAGGKSSRMGEDKALLPFADFSTLTEYQYTKLSKIFQSVYISTKEPSKFDFSANFLEDLPRFKEIYAPTAGFVTAFEQLQAEKIFVLSVDTPFVGVDEIQKILSADNMNLDATVAQTPSGTQAMCGVYHRSVLKKFIEMQIAQNYKLQSLLSESKTEYCFFKETKKFLNLNHPHEYQEALLLINS